MSHNHLEVEFKYSAKNISLESFNMFCQGLYNHESYRSNLGYDTFFTNIDRPETFFRLREDGDQTQVTYKRKTQADNSIRIEYNLDLAKGKEAAYALIEEMGYAHDTKITKVNHVHIFPWYVLSYYICYNENMVELDRFIEIEMREDKEWNTEQEIFSELKIVEKMFKPLGLSPERRIKESLYETYRRKV